MYIRDNRSTERALHVRASPKCFFYTPDFCVSVRGPQMTIPGPQDPTNFSGYKTTIKNQQPTNLLTGNRNSGLHIQALFYAVLFYAFSLRLLIHLHNTYEFTASPFRFNVLWLIYFLFLWEYLFYLHIFYLSPRFRNTTRA
jgi:hypothetical protein